jgi:hypothetical protein
MRYNEFVTEESIAKLKQTVAGKIVALPEIPQVEKTLGEIEGILSYVNAGGKMASIKGELVSIADNAVNKSQKLLAKYLGSIEMTPKDREELFKLWREDKLVNRKELLSGKNLPVGKIFNGYDTNPAIKEFVDDLSGLAALGQGKGEFMLSVLSKGINKMEKGDLKIDNLAVEVKTLDGGAGRFYDQEVKPASEYNSVRDVFLKKYLKYAPSTPKSGMTIEKMSDLVKIVDDKKEYEKDVAAIMETLFPGEDVKPIVRAIMNGNVNQAKQLYARTNMDYYVNTKKEAEALDGILYIDLSKDPMSMMYFKDISDLEKQNLRLHAKTIYPVTSDPRNAYPQITLTTTKHAADVISSSPSEELPKSSKTKEEPKTKAVPKAEPEAEPAPKMRAKKK